MGANKKTFATLGKASAHLELNGFQQSITEPSNNCLAVFTKMTTEHIEKAVVEGRNGKVRVVYTTQTL